MNPMKSCLVLAFLLLAGCNSELKQARADLGSPDPAVRAEACRVLAARRDKASGERVAVLLSDEDADVREQAAKALGRFGDAAAVEPLATFAEREPVEAAGAAGIRSLVELGDSAVGPLIRLVWSGRPWARAEAARGLGRLRAEAAVEPLIRLLGERDPDLAIAAVHALREIGTERALAAVAAAVENPNQDVERAAEQQLGGQGYEEQLDKAKRLARLRY